MSATSPMSIPVEVTDFDVLTCTTQQLEEMLNGYSDGWNVIQITHLAGRDWVVIATYEYGSAEERAEVSTMAKSAARD